MFENVVSAISGIFSVEVWRSISIWTAVFGSIAGGVSAISGHCATSLERQPRSVPSTRSNSHEVTLLPLDALFVVYGGSEAKGYATQLASAMPRGSHVEFLEIDSVTGIDNPGDGVLYIKNGANVKPALDWLDSIDTKYYETMALPVPTSLLMQNRNKIVIVIGPKKLTQD